MALQSDASSVAQIVYNMTGSGLETANPNSLGAGVVKIGKLPYGYVPLRISVVTATAGTGSSSPTIAVGISGSANKYNTAASLTVTAGYVARTVVAGYAMATAEEELILTYGGTMPTNSGYNAYLIIELMRVV